MATARKLRGKPRGVGPASVQVGAPESVFLYQTEVGVEYQAGMKILADALHEAAHFLLSGVGAAKVHEVDTPVEQTADVLRLAGERNRPRYDYFKKISRHRPQ